MADVPVSVRDIINSIDRVPSGSENEGFGRVYDVVRIVSGCDNAHVSREFEKVKKRFPEFDSLPKHQFPGPGQRHVPVADMDTLIQIVWCVDSKHARQFRAQCARMIRRIFVGEGDEDGELALAQRRRDTRAAQVSELELTNQLFHMLRVEASPDELQLIERCEHEARGSMIERFSAVTHCI